jgi:CRISPR-associated protein (TIGR03986 family)
MPEQRNNPRRNRSAHGGGFRPGAGGGQRRRIEPGPCPDSLRALKAAFDAIPAPYNFVPLSRWVHLPERESPEKVSQVSLDLPFKDGAFGEIPFTLVADTPLLVGAEQEKQHGAAGEVHFARAPDGTYLVPGSALRGMLRNVVEIACFGRMRQVDNARYGLRDITRADTPYARKVNQEIRAGFLRRGEGGKRVLVPCQFAKLSHADLERWWGERTPVFRAGAGVRKKYDLWVELCRRQRIENPLRIPCTIEGAPRQERVRSLSGPTLAFPVLTGQINDRERSRNAKQHDFVFFDRDDSGAIPVTDDDWRSFLLIHGDRDRERGGDSSAMRPSWPDYWRGRFDRGEDIPVFWLDAGFDREGQKRVRIGLARMPKLAWDWSIHELIENTSQEHLSGPEQGRAYDMADLLFGTLGDTAGRMLKGRVSVGHALAQPVSGRQLQPERHGPTILNGPKPTYFPNYIRQPADSRWRLPERQEYAGYIRTDENQSPEIRGFKRYPARPKAEAQPLTPEQQQGSQEVANILHPLPAGTRFSGRIVFHNLRPAELSALVWAITWGANDGLRHSLGMGKPFGFGQVRFEVDWSRTRLTRNGALAKGPGPIDRASACDELERHMLAAYETTDLPGPWRESPQVQALLAMADPARAAQFHPGLRHMRLQRCVDPARGRPGAYNEFVWAKQKRLVLAEYDGSAPAARQPSSPPRARHQDTSAPGRQRDRSHPTSPARPIAKPRAVIDNQWLETKVKEICKANNAPEDEVIGGKLLAAAWQEISDAEEKAAVLAAIKTLWEAKGWWADPPGRGKRKVKAIYDAK